MKRSTKISIIVIALTVFASYAQGQTTARDIDKYVKSVKKLTNSARNRIIVADTATVENRKANWKRFSSEKALEKFRERSETYSIAYNWKKNRKLVASHFTDFSGSGDWAEYTFHYFRSDGSIAKVEAELRTFYGHWIVVRNYYFDHRGKQIKKTSKYLDLTTKKPKKPTPELLADNQSGLTVQFYKTTSKLPFAKLIH